MKKFENIIIASDLDGTFLSSECGEVKRNIEKIKYFTENGGLFTFATGRIALHVQNALPNAASYVNAPMVSCNGMQLFDLKKGKTIRRNVVDLELHIEVIQYLRRLYPNTFYRTITEGGIAQFQPEHRYALEELAEKTVDYIYAEPEQLRDLNVYKLTLRDEPEILDEIKTVIEEKYGDHYHICKSWCDLLEIMTKGYTKATMLKDLQAELSEGGKLKKLYAVGDYENDLEMLSVADVAVCPENAVDSVKAVCDHCFGDNDSGVIADLIEYIDKTVS